MLMIISGKYGKVAYSFDHAARGGSRRNADGIDLIILPYLLNVFGETGLRNRNIFKVSSCGIGSRKSAKIFCYVVYTTL